MSEGDGGWVRNHPGKADHTRLMAHGPTPSASMFLNLCMCSLYRVQPILEDLDTIGQLTALPLANSRYRSR
jgi:hypothetical protein